MIYGLEKQKKRLILQIFILPLERKYLEILVFSILFICSVSDYQLGPRLKFCFLIHLMLAYQH